MKKIVSILAFTILSLVVFSQTEGKWYKLKFVNSSGEKQMILFKGLASAIELQSHLNGGIAFVGATSFTKEFVPMGTNLSKTVSVNQFVSINTAAMTLFREIQNQSHGEDGFLSTTTPNIFAVADGSLKKFIQIHWNTHYQAWVFMSFDVNQNITAKEKDVLLFTPL
jgi:hypothetical protein